MTFSKKEVKRLRELRGFTQLKAAAALNLTEKAYQQKELGNNTFTANEAALLAQLFKVEVGALYADNV